MDRNGPQFRSAGSTNGLDRSTRTQSLETPPHTQPSSRSTPVLGSASPPQMPASTARAVSPIQDQLLRISRAPATKTTVVTTTTTTTVSFPPFVIKKPRLARRDLRLFPLADKPVPSAIRGVAVDVDGEAAIFEEASDPEAALNQYEAQKAMLAAHGGTFTSTITTQSRGPQNPHRLWSGSRKRAGGPLARSALPKDGLDARWSSKKRRTDPLGIATPHVRPRTPLKDACQDTPSSMPREDNPDGYAPSPPSPPSFLEAPAMAATPPSPPSFLEAPAMAATPPSPPSFVEAPAMAATPPAADQDAVQEHSRAYDRDESKRVTPSLDTAVARHDGSLPSPVYSPVTAIETPSLSEVEDDDLHPLERTSRGNDVFEETGLNQAEAIADAVHCFDALPPSLQKYLAFQLLRRSDKGVLQFIAGIVNPALKCDFLARLPVELALHVVGYLDATTLCRAAQVSKKWRQLVDSYDRVWKELIDEDGFAIPKGELERAIHEGWAWQGALPLETDLSRVLRPKADPADEPVRPKTARVDSYVVEVAGRKRRAFAQKGPAAKRMRGIDYELQAELARLDAADVISPDLPRVLLPDVPHALRANHAALGLHSLRVPHLFKSLYRRQQCIRHSWMDPRTQPKHTAFRAHGRHVVTCLQFDEDKILTGSDDTKIHVYNARDGSLRTVLDGHEGGVWALQCVGRTLVSGSTDRTVRVWDAESGECRHVFHGHTSTVRCLVVLQPTQVGVDSDGEPIMRPREPLIITGSRDATLRVWRLPPPEDMDRRDGGPVEHEDPEPQVRGDGRGGLTVPAAPASEYFVRSLRGHVHSVRSIAAHGDTLVSGSYDSTVRVWRVSTGETVHRLAGHASKVYSVILDHARKRCVSGSMDNLVKVWSLETGACLFNLEGHSSLVGLLDLSHGRLVSAAADATLRVWEPENGHCRKVLAAHSGAITCFQHDGVKVISGSDRSLKMWDVRTGACVRDLLTDLSGGWQVKFNDRKCVAAVQRRNRTYIEVLDFGAARDAEPTYTPGVRTVVDDMGEPVVVDVSSDDEEPQDG